MDQYAAARTLMVDGQVRPNKVTNPRLIDALRTLPRERFLPPHLAALAYADEDVPLPGGRALMEPMVLARLVQLLAPRDGDRVLVVGAGTGYGAAVLAACGARVVALEDDSDLLAIARPALMALAPGVALIEAPVSAGWPGGAPYDTILVEGAVADLPAAILAQVRPPAAHLGGRIAMVRRVGQGVCHGGLGEVVGGKLSFQPVFDCATPVLPRLAAVPKFVF